LGVDDLEVMRRTLESLPDPVAMLAGIFSASHVPLQLYSAQGRSLLTNRAFLELFGAIPPPEYCVLDDDIAREHGLLQEIHRAFAGQMVTMPPVWYDPREMRHVQVTEGRRVAMSATFLPIFHVSGTVSYVVVSFRDVTAQLRAQEQARRAARIAQLGAQVGEHLLASVELRTHLHELLALCVPGFADWCIATLRSPTGARERAAMVHRDPALEPECEHFRVHPLMLTLPEGEDAVRLRCGLPVLISEATPAWLEGIAQDAEHLRALHVFGTRSVIVAPLGGPGRALGALWFVRGAAAPRFEAQEVSFAEDLANRVALAVDNVRRVEAERDARAQVEQALRAHQALVSDVSQRLSGPTRALAQRLDAAEALSASANGEVAQQLLAARQEVAELSARVGELRDWSLLSLGALGLSLSRTDWVPLIRRCAERLGPAANLQLALPNASVGHWDGARLEQVVTHLLSYAVRFGGGLPVQVRLDQTEERVTLEIRDGGRDIPPDQLARLFEPLQADPSSAEAGGASLGFWVSRRLVEAMGGKLSVWSEPGAGTAFTLMLPRTGEPGALPHAPP
jgi:signal transduction histidine kinase